MKQTSQLQLTALLGSSKGKDDVIRIYRLRFSCDRESVVRGEMSFLYVFVSSEELTSQ